MTSYTDLELREMFLNDIITTDDYCEFITLKKNSEDKCNHTRKIFDIQRFTKHQCGHNFRFSQEELVRICKSLQIPEQLKTSQRHSYTGLEGLCVLLRRMSYTARWFDLVQIFQRDETSLCRIFLDMIDLITTRWVYLLKDTNHNWLSHMHLENYAQAIVRRGGIMTDVVGMIDGTARHICRPHRDQKIYYSGHKRHHCIKFQSVVIPSGLIAHLDGGYPGSRHDSAIYILSGLRKKLDSYMNVRPNIWYRLYGDQGYANTKYVVSPYRGNLSVINQQFNDYMKVPRLSVEWSFGCISRDWDFVNCHLQSKIFLSEVEKIYYVAAILTNVRNCLRPNIISQFFSVLPPTLEQYLS